MAGSGTELNDESNHSFGETTDSKLCNFSLFIVLFAAIVFRQPNQNSNQAEERADGEKEALAATAAEKEKDVAKSESCQSEQTQVGLRCPY